jgi:2-methylisocitrate lyase-like PEP mutase family enzyme
MTMTQPDLATRFAALHRGPEVLLLPNAWDAGSARLIESRGARAIATTSAAVAWAHGYPDGDAVPTALVVATTAAIARVIRVPLSVDIEAGYSDDPAAVGALVGALIDAGAVGINLEDGGGTADLLCGKLAVCAHVARQRGVALYINARTDVYLRELVPGAERVAETCARGRRYRDAGASGLFVPRVVEPAAIAAIARAVDLPLNVLASPGLLPAAELAALGVRRLSAGSWIAQAVAGRTAALVDGFLATGGAIDATGALSYRELNQLAGAR